ncbi:MULTISPECIES: PilN domain-containing protein [Clostridioides]|uniref:PilN domain-containing protein n=1 Tax=Clostridioides sp. ZZV14-6387 TaxID=2811497 RepID=UPI0007BBE257|nr:PilN domain-containing protein [Clostridioides sp. ZZV14-6387]CZR98937.1 Fimbrial assembly protein (PilN) [Clostridioides difficile]CZS11601.1 Fimbrial assembly protein (PilN) [Clostridioides difficile]
MNKVYVSYYGDSISIVEGRYKHDKDKFYIKNFNAFSIEDIAQDFSKEKYALLRYALENIKLKSRHVVFCLNTRDVILKPQKLPKMDKKDLDGFMKLEMDEMMALESDEYVFSYEVSSETSDSSTGEESSLNLIIGAIKKEEINAIVEIMHEFDLILDRIDTLSTAYLRILKNLDYNDIMVTNISDNSTIINIYKKDTLFISDNIPIRITAKDMEMQLLNVVEESKGLMNYYSSRNFGKVTDTILILGKRYSNKLIYEAFSSAFSNYVSQGLTEIMDISDMITGDIDEDDINSIVELLGSMIEPKGKKDFENINFLPMDILKKQMKAKQVKNILKIAPIVILVLAIPYLCLIFSNSLANKELENVNDEIRSIESAYYQIGNIEKMIQSKTEEIKVYDMLIGKKVKWENLLDDIDKNTPSRVELTSLSTTYQNFGTTNKTENSNNDKATTNKSSNNETKSNTKSNSDGNKTSSDLSEEKTTNISEALTGDSKTNDTDTETDDKTPLYDKIPNIINIEGNAKDSSYVGQFLYKLKGLYYFEDVKLHSIKNNEEDSNYTFNMTLYLKEGVLTNE